MLDNDWLVDLLIGLLIGWMIDWYICVCMYYQCVVADWSSTQDLSSGVSDHMLTLLRCCSMDLAMVLLTYYALWDAGWWGATKTLIIVVNEVF